MIVILLPLDPASEGPGAPPVTELLPATEEGGWMGSSESFSSGEGSEAHGTGVVLAELGVVT